MSGQHTRRRHVDMGTGAGGAATRDTHGFGYNPVPTDPYYGSFIDYEMITTPEIPADIIDGQTHIMPGTISHIAFDPTPPAMPTDLVLSSEVQADADGHSILRLIITLTQPADSDLYGCWVEYTNLDGSVDPDPPAPDWDRPGKVFIPAAVGKASVDGVAGGTLYWARAYAVDVQGNRSATTAVVSHTTGKDAEAPNIPTTLSLVGGFRGFGASFDASEAADLMFSELRFAPDDGTGTAPDTNNWSIIRTKNSALFVGGLDGDARYWVQVRCVDLSGNVMTSLLDPTAVDYVANPEAGWSAQETVVTLLVGQADIAFDSITADHIIAGSLSADDIGAGTLTIRPLESFARGIEVRGADDALLGRWDELGLKVVDPLDPARYLLLDSGQMKFTQDGGATFPTAITPEGINASAISFGNAPGGHNLILNSSFELADFVAAPSVVTFTDFNMWAAANRTVAPDNIADGGAITALAMTATGYA